MYHILIQEGKRKMFEKEPDLLTRRQVQELLHVSKNTILKMIHEGELPAIVVAGSYRIEKRNIIEYIQDPRRERNYF